MPDAAGKLSPAEKQAIIASLTSHGLPPPKCPICGRDDWGIADYVTQPVTIDGSGKPSLTTFGMPNVAVISASCGYTMYVNAFTIGLLGSQPSAAAAQKPKARSGYH